MSLIRGLFWIALFIFFAFCFIVLFEHGTADFSTGFRTEFKKGKEYVQQAINPPAKKDDKARK